MNHLTESFTATLLFANRNKRKKVENPKKENFKSKKESKSENCSKRVILTVTKYSKVQILKDFPTTFSVENLSSLLKL